MDDVGARNRKMIEEAKSGKLNVSERGTNEVGICSSAYIRSSYDGTVHETYIASRVINVRECLKEAVASLSDVIYARFIANLEAKAKAHDDKVIQECKKILDDLGVEY